MTELIITGLILSAFAWGISAAALAAAVSAALLAGKNQSGEDRKEKGKKSGGGPATEGKARAEKQHWTVSASKAGTASGGPGEQRENKTDRGHRNAEVKKPSAGRTGDIIFPELKELLGEDCPFEYTLGKDPASAAKQVAGEASGRPKGAEVPKTPDELAFLEILKYVPR